MKCRFLSVIVLVILMIFGCSGDSKKQDGGGAGMAGQMGEPYDSIVIALDGRAGESVFDLLKEKHEVEFIGSAMGNFVHVIDSVSINKNYSWNYFVNDTMGNVASDKYITDDGDKVEWRYRKFEN